MSFILSSHIEFGSQIKLDFVTEVSIESSWRLFTDTAEIQIPRNIRIAGDPDGIKKYIKQGDRVLIQLGYDGNLVNEFEGFVNRISPKIPLTIFCEDYMYHLKRVSFTNSWKQVTLQDLVAYLVNHYNASGRPRIEFECEQTSVIGSFVFEETTILKALEVLKDTVGFVSFFRGNKLFVGFPYKLNGQSRSEKYHFQKNVVTDDLEYRLAEDLRIKLKATSHQPNGQKITVDVGDPDGEERTYTAYKMDKESLKAKAESELELYKRTGYRGSLTGFGIPFVQHGDSVTIIDNEFPEREGRYVIDKTIVKFGTGGFRRTVEIGKQL